MNRDRLKTAVADNIAFYRKKSGFTQQQLAERLNYSDKAVSKWERGDGMPDLMVLNDMADIFGITLNDFTRNPKNRKYHIIRQNKIVISLFSAGLVWLVATMLFVMLSMVAPTYSRSWMCFIYAIPASCLVLFIFSCIWKNKWIIFSTYTLLIWSVLLAVFLAVTFSHSSYIFIVGIPLQVLGILWLIKRKERTV